MKPTTPGAQVMMSKGAWIFGAIISSLAGVAAGLWVASCFIYGS